MNGPDSAPPVPEEVVKSSEVTNKPVKPGWRQKVGRFALAGLGLLSVADKAIPPNPQPVNSPQAHAQEIDLKDTFFAKNQQALGQTAIDPRDVSSYVAHPTAVAGAEATVEGQVAKIESSKSVDPAPAKVTAEAPISPEKKAARERMINVLNDVQDVVGIPGAAKLVSEDPDKGDYGSFMILNDADGNPAFIFVTKGACGMQYQNAIEYIPAAVKVINQISPKTVKEELAEDGPIVIASDVTRSPYKSPNEEGTIFDQKEYAGYEGMFVLEKGQRIVLANRDFMASIAQALAVILAEAKGAQLLKEENGVYSEKVGKGKTLFLGEFVKENESLLSNLDIPGYSYVELKRFVEYEESRYLKN